MKAEHRILGLIIELLLDMRTKMADLSGLTNTLDSIAAGVADLAESIKELRAATPVDQQPEIDALTGKATDILRQIEAAKVAQ